MVHQRILQESFWLLNMLTILIAKAQKVLLQDFKINLDECNGQNGNRGKICKNIFRDAFSVTHFNEGGKSEGRNSKDVSLSSATCGWSWC